MKGFSRKQRKRVEAAFHTFAGADILIDFGEWKRALGMRNDFLAQRIFEVVDADGTGFIDRDATCCRGPTRTNNAFIAQLRVDYVQGCGIHEPGPPKKIAG